MKKLLSLVLSLVMLLSCTAPYALTANAMEPTDVQGTMYYDYAVDVLNRINVIRAEYGAPKLVMTKVLCDGAQLRAAEIVFNLSHTRPNGEPFYTAFEWHVTAGENLAAGQSTPEAVVNAWMNSPGHKANIINGEFLSIGIACFENNGKVYWVQNFSGVTGEPYTPSGTVSTTCTVSSLPSSLTNSSGSQQGGSGSGSGSDSSSSGSSAQSGSTLLGTEVSSLKKGRKYLKVRWKRIDAVDGYEFQYSTSKKFKKKKTVKIKQSNIVGLTATGLKSKKKYYVRVRTYMTYNGKKIYSKWSKVKAVKVK